MPIELNPRKTKAPQTDPDIDILEKIMKEIGESGQLPEPKETKVKERDKVTRDSGK